MSKGAGERVCGGVGAGWGYGRRTVEARSGFLKIARGSLSLLLASVYRDMNYVQEIF